ncbi:MAG: hypothetical protein ACLF0G_17605 [Candidatus Brocadiia bacterium]
MRARPPILLAVLAVAGCAMDPSIYEGYGTTPPPREEAARPVPPPQRPAAEKGDIRIMPAKPTFPARSPTSVAIVVEKLGTDRRSAADAQVAFRLANDNVAVASPGGRVARRNGLRIGVAGENLRARLDTAARRTSRTTRESMFIVVESGSEGFIQVGRDVFVQGLRYWTPRGWQTIIERGFVGRQLVVRPRILPGRRVEVVMWPRFTTRTRRGAIDVTELSTRVVVPDGHSLVVGGTTTGSDSLGAVLFGLAGERRAGSMTMVLTPKIGGLDIDWPKGEW